MIDAMFQAGTDQALDDQVQRPKPFQPEAPKFGLGQTLLGVPQGVASGSTKTAAFAAEILGAFGTTEAATGVSAGGMFATQTPEERKQAEEARRKVLENDNLFSNEVGDELRRRAKDVMPDPNSTHAAAQVVAGVTEFATQAVTYAAGAGPVAPLLLGADVALAEADKLKGQGVDFPTRAKAGAVAGVTAGVSIALPVAVPGSVAKTAAAVVAGGPGGFIAQNAAERAILKNAGYEKQANQYDPLDPVGLALSTLVPAGFGAVAVRGARAKPAPTLHEVVLSNESNGQRYAKDGSVLTSPKGAKGEMQVMDATNLDPGFGVRPAANNSLEERARVGHDYLDAMLKRYGGDEAKAMAAYNAGPGALDAALKKGGDWLSHMPKETQDYVAKGMRKLGEGRVQVAARDAVAADPDTVAAARVQQTAATVDAYRLSPETDIAGMTAHQDAIESAHALIARGEPVEVTDLIRVEPAAEHPFTPWAQQVDAAISELRVTRQVDSTPAVQALRQAEPRAADGVAPVEKVDGSQQAKATGKESAPAGVQDPAAPRPPAPPAARSTAGELAPPPPSPLSQAAARVEQARPDMPVRITEDGQRLTASQELETIRREAAEGTDVDLGANDASLLQVAANCFLGLG